MICPKCKKKIKYVYFEIEPDNVPGTGSIEIDEGGVCVGEANFDYIDDFTGPDPDPTFTCPICNFDLTHDIDADEFWDLC
jgi:hypothetical protein